MDLLTMCGEDVGMENAVTVVPVGSFTPQVSERVCAAAIANSSASPVVIALHGARDFCWSALAILASALRGADTAYPIRIAYTRPQTRALLNEFGIENLRHMGETSALTGRRIFIA